MREQKKREDLPQSAQRTQMTRERRLTAEVAENAEKKK